MSPRFGYPPVRGATYTRRPGVYAILQKGSRFLLTIQSTPELEFQLPGGGIDPGESPLRALHREVWEETGWGIKNPRKIAFYRRFVYMPEYELLAEKICHIYVATPTRQRNDPIETDHTAFWCSHQEALDVLTNSGDRHFFKKVLQ